MDLTVPIRSQVLLSLVGDLLCYSGANEVNVQLYMIRSVCREMRDQIDEECLTFCYDDACGLASISNDEAHEIHLLNRCVRRHPRLKYFECLLRSLTKFEVILRELELPEGTRCSFSFEFKMSADALRQVLERFHVRRLSLIPEHTATEDIPGRANDWSPPAHTRLRTLCLRNCTNEIARALISASPRLQVLQIIDSRLNSLSDTGLLGHSLLSLSLTGVVTMPDEQFSQLISACQNLRSLTIYKCHVSNIKVALPRLELMSVTHCRQLTDVCATELLRPTNNPSLRFVDLTEDRGLVSPALAHPGLEIAWLMHCPHLNDQAVTRMFQSCHSLTAVNLVQSSIENALICSPVLQKLELTTSQKLTDNVVTQLLQHCPNLTFLDVGHCCTLTEPEFAHASLETILLSFCVKLCEPAICGLFANCPALRYVELAVCMFDMTRFQREHSPRVQVVVNFDF